MVISFIDIAKARADVATYHRANDVLNNLSGNSMMGLAIRIAEKHKLTVGELRGKDRTRKTTWPRQELMWECRAKGFSLPQIARFLGRDHTTILFGCRQHEKRMMEAAR